MSTLEASPRREAEDDAQRGATGRELAQARTLASGVAVLRYQLTDDGRASK